MEQDELLRRVVETLEREKLPYLITGSIATIFYGEPRFTNDPRGGNIGSSRSGWGPSSGPLFKAESASGRRHAEPGFGPVAT